MKDKKNMILNVIIFGSVWGFMEAILGYLLHWLPQLISGNIMFPIGAAVLLLAYKTTSSRIGVIGAGLIAIAIKSVNLLMPNINMFKVLNPMIAMLLQTLIVAVIMPQIISRKSYIRNLLVLSSSLIWRGAFVAVMLFQYLINGSLPKYLATVGKAAGFVLADGALSGIFAVVLVAAVLIAEQRITINYKYKPNPVVAAAFLAIAVTAAFMV